LRRTIQAYFGGVALSVGGTKGSRKTGSVYRKVYFKPNPSRTGPRTRDKDDLLLNRSLLTAHCCPLTQTGVAERISGAVASRGVTSAT
jgi:hypothetical protein